MVLPKITTRTERSAGHVVGQWIGVEEEGGDKHHTLATNITPPVTLSLAAF
jgi:hypothetical protein